ncbi:MAG: twin-arginine translocase TatA/TatE family subunit [Spirochaetes bacterium]|nr:twin-arginine translocase TatA/TatE family subunit [Spirochaetota bacterium]
MLSTAHLLIVVAVVVLLFGASAIPKFAKSLGQAKGEFEKGLRESREEAEKNAANPSPQVGAPKSDEKKG